MSARPGRAAGRLFCEEILIGSVQNPDARLVPLDACNRTCGLQYEPILALCEPMLANAHTTATRSGAIWTRASYGDDVISMRAADRENTLRRRAVVVGGRSGARPNTRTIVSDAAETVAGTTASRATGSLGLRTSVPLPFLGLRLVMRRGIASPTIGVSEDNEPPAGPRATSDTAAADTARTQAAPTTCRPATLPSAVPPGAGRTGRAPDF